MPRRPSKVRVAQLPTRVPADPTAPRPRPGAPPPPAPSPLPKDRYTGRATGGRPPAQPGDIRVLSPRVVANQRAFLTAYASCGQLTHAAKAAGVHTRHHYEWLRVDPTYPQRFLDAREAAIDNLERAAWSRAVDGVARPVYYKGAVVGYVQEYSDTLLLALLKGFRPERYREAAVAPTPPPPAVSLSTVPLHLRRALLEHLRRAQADAALAADAASADAALSADAVTLDTDTYNVSNSAVGIGGVGAWPEQHDTVDPDTDDAIDDSDTDTDTDTDNPSGEGGT